LWCIVPVRRPCPAYTHTQKVPTAINSILFHVVTRKNAYRLISVKRTVNYE